ncbi:MULTISPECIES: hypothetical protein [unclassified Shinella]|uniref:hypothetical protein n=1 Tax=unclassified Shinella TaxID=2643062 RepID=UPI00234F010E|nr:MULTISPECIES: hypothetical protein [unclassified Shinella]MCO5153918.1 hypothetical protein [Shinella sp.]MDC7262859.1 hypothetical protein [Shinella sp. HY16]MDC7269754.1 hypothetical protein [Shinella sp. YZ44]
MDEVADFFNSEEMKAVVTAIEALRSKYAQAVFLPQTERITFFQLLTGKFPAREVLQKLANNDAGYPGQKDVMAAAFSAWLLFPKKKEIRHNWMLHAMLLYMDQAEKKAGLYEEDWVIERDIAARYLFIGGDFLKDIFDSAGGYQAFMDLNSNETIDAILDHNMRTIRTAARSMLYLHHGAQLFQDEGVYHRPSVNLSSKIFKEIRKVEAENRENIVSRSEKNSPSKIEMAPYTYVARSSLHKIWKEDNGTMALIYAASCLRITRSRYLLDVLLNAEFSHSDHGRLIPQWLGMARYAGELIFPKMDDARLLRRASRFLDIADPVPFHAPKLTSQEDALFKRIFRKYFQSSR